MKPLKGIRVLCFAVNLPGALLAHRLMKLGASVTKVEPPTRDPLKHHFPSCYRFLCKGMRVQIFDRSVSLTRKKVERELKLSHLFLTACRESTLHKLNWNWKAVHANYPRLNMLSIFGYPAPHHDLPGHDLTYQAMAGFVQPPALPVTSTADVAGVQEALIECLLLLRESERSKKGGYSIVSLSGALEMFNLPIKQGMFKKGTLLRSGSPLYNLYPTRSGWVAFAALEPHFREIAKKELCPTLSFPALKRIFLKKTANEWEKWAKKRGFPLVRVRSI